MTDHAQAPKFSFQLFVAGTTMNSGRAIQTMSRFLDKHAPGAYQLTIIDVLEQPEIAEKQGIIATPTLIRLRPPPVRRILGDLTGIDPSVVWDGVDDIS